MSLQVPNVVIHDPRARKIIRTTLDVLGVILGVITIADTASDQIDLVIVSAPALAVYAFLRATLTITVDNPNTPVGKRGVRE